MTHNAIAARWHKHPRETVELILIFNTLDAAWHTWAKNPRLPIVR
jgi:hypothetical protein